MATRRRVAYSVAACAVTGMATCLHQGDPGPIGTGRLPVREPVGARLLLRGGGNGGTTRGLTAWWRARRPRAPPGAQYQPVVLCCVLGTWGSQATASPRKDWLTGTSRGSLWSSSALRLMPIMVSP